MWRAASLHRKAITRATSSGSATRPNTDSCSARSSISRGRVDKSSVFTNPGATAFTLTLEGPRSTAADRVSRRGRSEEHTSELQSRQYLVCRLLLEKKKTDSSVRL